MLQFIKNFENSIIVLHEIYGINDHIQKVCAEYHEKGFDVFCPPLFFHDVPFKYSQQKEAYGHFVNHCLFNTSGIVSLLRDIRADYKKIILVGFSVGATMAWLSAESNLCDGIVCYYGSRIRDYLNISPNCPSLVILARFEKSFNPLALQKALINNTFVSCHILNSYHGFSDPYGSTFNHRDTCIARNIVYNFIDTIVK
ncbi:hypothetical protein DVH07_18460 [Hafnia paralvei]|uniref:dienelactone hydrolase family protein n=1 Tax=Hafnia paralvei TaxID=546367 RepID=UPI000DF452B2|nr:dienelactone hydrolase family protein [Hafnia paralvei]RDA61926.1 hypothetical protein DU449_18020 [Hafnia paralvei]RDA62986.1 hypothetical protein DVH08_20230 [Hafnia paralvei]RDA63826.1 hypothetical protein DVH09_18590 [Hafnia paralvei]RDA75112.1 hypothetical protein DVH10_17760 [Hafnia paralvei]RDA75517.1 hypothetical protein DVH07_18460 [Hafnia paralvei]